MCAAATDNHRFSNVLSSAAFFIINDQWFCYPGAIFPGLVEMYYPHVKMKHLFVPPYLWGDQPETLHLSSRTVAWLLAVPISSEEWAFAERHGSDALEDRFVHHQIDIYDLDRATVVSA